MTIPIIDAARLREGDRLLAQGFCETRTWADGLLPRVLPRAWHRLNMAEGLHSGFFVACQRTDGLRVIVSVKRERDGGTWQHVSFSRADRVPSHEDTLDVRRTFVRDSLFAYQVYPPQAQYVNIHPHCLHLWARLEGPVTPDFRSEDGQL